MRSMELVLAESIIEKLKPVAEEVSGLKLAKLEISLSKMDSSCPMEYSSPNEIIIYSKYWTKYWDYKKLLGSTSKELSWSLSLFKLVVAHELGHHIEYTINPYSIEGYNTSLTLDIIIEGFAEYFCLDLLPKGTLLPDIVRSGRKRWFDVHKNSIYGIGYRFFRAITTKLGKEEPIHIIKNLDVSFKELKNPGSYIERRKIKNA